MSGFRDSAEIKKFARTRRSFLRHAGLAQTDEQGASNKAWIFGTPKFPRAFNRAMLV